MTRIEVFRCPDYGFMQHRACVARHGHANGGSYRAGDDADLFECIGCELGAEHARTGKVRRGLETKVLEVVAGGAWMGRLVVPPRRGARRDDRRACEACGETFVATSRVQRFCPTHGYARGDAVKRRAAP